MHQLSDAFTQVEQTYGALDCVEGFQIEVKYLIDNGIDLAAWQQVPMSKVPGAEALIWLIPQDSVLAGAATTPPPVI